MNNWYNCKCCICNLKKHTNNKSCCLQDKNQNCGCGCNNNFKQYYCGCEEYNYGYNQCEQSDYGWY